MAALNKAITDMTGMSPREALGYGKPGTPFPDSPVGAMVKMAELLGFQNTEYPRQSPADMPFEPIVPQTISESFDDIEGARERMRKAGFAMNSEDPVRGLRYKPLIPQALRFMYYGERKPDPPEYTEAMALDAKHRDLKWEEWPPDDCLRLIELTRKLHGMRL